MNSNFTIGQKGRGVLLEARERSTVSLDQSGARERFKFEASSSLLWQQRQRQQLLLLRFFFFFFSLSPRRHCTSARAATEPR
ncbi:hypothetical protein F2P81_022305 [Scophthalmus maximus]|uniref:Uncharacterized protein n=1 Tax=Scophthalmus maximus TaxID=52904 RepID=A0A6A4S4I6_SCOMX|nr:hypothetical protein F2P81_022305 [Scophthalmus maximus]